MSKNILQKFRKSLEQSSKIVYDSGLNSHRSSPKRSELETIKQYTDKMENQPSRPSLQQSQKLLKKIPVLVSQNDELRQKVKKLENQLKQKQTLKNTSERPHHKAVKTEVSNEYENRFGKYHNDCSSGSSMIGARLYESLRIGSLWDTSDRKTKPDSLYSYHSLQKRSELAHLQTQIVKFLEKKIDELRAQNNELQVKYNKVVQSKKQSSEEIDRIKQNFQTTLAHQTEVFQKKQDFYIQKIKTLQSNIFQISQQCKLLKLNNENLVQKTVDLQIALNKRRFNSKDIIVNYKNKCVEQKHNNIVVQDIKRLWAIKQTEYSNIHLLLEGMRSLKNK